MLSREDNEIVTRVGPGTPMGNTLRMYWVPALLSQEIAEPAGPPVRVGSAARTRSTLATALLGCAGLVALGAALVVRVHWHDNPVMTTLGVILALALGISGLFYLLAALWLLLTGRSGLAAADRASAA